MNRRKKILLALSMVTAVIAAGYGAWYLLNSDGYSGVDRPEQTTNTDNQSSIDYSEPSEEQQQTPSVKQPQSDDNNSGDNNGDITVVLTRVNVGDDTITAAGYANTDTNGTCTLTFTSGNNTKTYTAPSQSDPANPDRANCSSFSLPKSDLSASDTWTAQLTYSYDGASFVSQNTIEVNL